MFSPDMAVPLAALKKLAPGHELEQMEAFQSAFYGEGRDVLAPEVQMRIANVDGDVFMRALEDPGVQAAAKPNERKRSIYWVTLWFIPRSFLKRTTASAMCWRNRSPIIPLWPPSLPPCSAEEPAARRHAPPTRAASTGIAIFQHEKKFGEGAFSKKFPPRTPPAKTSIRGEAAQRESVPVKGKTSYPMCKPFPAVSFKSKTRPACPSGFFFYPKV